MRSDRGLRTHTILKPPLTALSRICVRRTAAAPNIDERELPEPLPGAPSE
eukprot:COSAG06_NODE_1595_length_8979_cov_126.558784_7_plen_50_part_00